MMKKVFLILLLSLSIGSCSNLSAINPLAQINQDDCVLFIHDPSEKREIWFSCDGRDSQILVAGIQNVQDFAAADNANEIYFTLPNDNGGTDIWFISKQKNEPSLLVDCGNSTCGDLTYNSESNRLAYTESGNNSILDLLDLVNDSTKSYPYSASDLAFSPNGNYLSFFDSSREKLVALDLSTDNHFEEDSQEGLIGGWSSDSRLFLYGATDYWGGIPGTNMFVLNLNTGNSEMIIDGSKNLVEYYRPLFYQPADSIITAVRERSSGFTRQLWLINSDGNPETQITSDFTYDNSSAQLNTGQTKLVFQRYNINRSDSQPEVWIYDFSSGELIKVAENAAHPQWIP